MVENGLGPIPDVSYVNPAGTELGIEVTTLESLWRRAAPGRHLARPQRPSFHLLFLVAAGHGTHTVDFLRHDLTAGSVVWVRPGQVQQFDPAFRLRGPLVLFQPGFAPAGAADDPFGPGLWRLAGTRRRLVTSALRHLDEEYAAVPPAWTTAHAAVLAHLLGALLRRLALPEMLPADGPAPAVVAPAHQQVYARFRAAVERDFAATRQVEDYARALGYSPRTIARATRAATGLGAKAFIDRRIVLEAKRLLAHTDLPAARIGSRLGFSDATNFLKFFHQRTGTTPGAFRAEVIGGGHGRPQPITARSSDTRAPARPDRAG